MNRRKFITRSLMGVGGVVAAGTYWHKRWKYIVIHHSAGSFGTIEFLQQVHRERQPRDPVDAIPYHYVIGNGNGLAMGKVASDWRQQYGLWGMHVSANNSDRNFRGIGIFLIGNYEENQLPEPQYQALVKLTTELMVKHNIFIDDVTGHGLTEGESTKCPGKHFPMQRFKQDLKNT